MPKKQQKFADDGWAIWVEGDDTSTIHINDWLNPKGKEVPEGMDITYVIGDIRELLNVLE